jgi:hypothetical protein
LNLFGRLFHRENEEKAIAFVDYEYWFYSYKTQFGMTPDPMKWRENPGVSEEFLPFSFYIKFLHRNTASLTFSCLSGRSLLLPL